MTLAFQLSILKYWFLPEFEFQLHALLYTRKLSQPPGIYFKPNIFLLFSECFWQKKKKTECFYSKWAVSLRLDDWSYTIFLPPPFVLHGIQLCKYRQKNKSVVEICLSHRCSKPESKPRLSDVYDTRRQAEIPNLENLSYRIFVTHFL